MLSRWSYFIVTVQGAPNHYSAKSFVDNLKPKLKQQFVNTGFKYQDPTSFPNHEIRLTSDGNVETMFRHAASKGVDLLLVVLPTKIPVSTYSVIKRFGDVQYGIATICVSAFKLQKAKSIDSYLGNMMMKFNLKLGGNNQFVNFKNTTMLDLDQTMIVGIDVTHPSPGCSDNAPSIAGMVASVDSRLGQWPAVLRLQSGPRNEMVSELKEMLETRLSLWKGKNMGRYPKNILVYRDGVSEGQYKQVVEGELPLLREACESTYSAPEKKQGFPRFTLVIVGKRHHTRFYPTQMNDAYGKKSNTYPGTVVDRGVTEAQNWDFFLQPHSGNEGTVRPIHYFVLRDEIFGKWSRQDAVNRLERMTHDLCYVYGRATKAVSVCTPAYYADIVCERGRNYLSRLYDHGEPGEKAKQSEIDVHPKLKNTMFYI